MTKFYNYHDSILGKLLMISDEEHLLGLYFAHQKNIPNISNLLHFDHPIFAKTKVELEEYFYSKRTIFKVPYKLIGSIFQNKVWEQLKSIQYGSLSSYLDIANLINAPKAVRAVANAIGSNPISIIIPCHRIIRKTKHIGGYAGGINIKKQILDLEFKASAQSLYN